MTKRFCQLLTVIVIMSMLTISCTGRDTGNDVIEEPVLETGLEVDDDFAIVSPQTTFNLNEKFYITFFNDESLGTNLITLQVTDVAGEILVNRAYEVNPEWKGMAIEFDSSFTIPGVYAISIIINDRVRASQEVTIE
ncbi:MAG TPA: hypothetical protein VLH18_01535 [Candidatus Limnocylindrales bacterium]|nr:hypothetical protein [Candidatus Limnocylindrales bacterium]